MIRTDQDMTEFMYIPLVIVRKKGVAMETVKINVIMLTSRIGVVVVRAKRAGCCCDVSGNGRC